MDAGRILAATVIFYFHAGLLCHFPLFPYGEYAVEYFIILSGITYALFSNPITLTVPNYFAYVKKRLTALFPMFVLVNVVLYAASFCSSSTLGRPYKPVEFLVSATGLSMYFGWKYMSTVMWFMPFIVQVYLLLPLIDWCVRRVNPVILMLASFCVSCLMAQVAVFFLKDVAPVDLVCKNWSPVLRLPEVCAGVIMGRMALKDCDYWKGLSAVILFGVLSLLVSVSQEAGWLANFYMPWNGFLVPMLVLGASWLVAPLAWSVRPEIMRLLGMASFAFYLLHAAPIVTVAHRFGCGVSVWLAYYFGCWVLAVGLTLILARIKKPAPTRPA